MCLDAPVLWMILDAAADTRCRLLPPSTAVGVARLRRWVSA